MLRSVASLVANRVASTDANRAAARSLCGGTRAGVFSGRQALEKMFAADFASNPGRLVSELAQVYAMGDNDICAIGNASVGTWKAYTVTAYVRALDGTWKIHMTYVNPL